MHVSISLAVESLIMLHKDPWNRISWHKLLKEIQGKTMQAYNRKLFCLWALFLEHQLVPIKVCSFNSPVWRGLLAPHNLKSLCNWFPCSITNLVRKIIFSLTLLYITCTFGVWGISTAVSIKSYFIQNLFLIGWIMSMSHTCTPVLTVIFIHLFVLQPQSCELESDSPVWRGFLATLLSLMENGDGQSPNTTIT